MYKMFNMKIAHLTLGWTENHADIFNINTVCEYRSTNFAMEA